MYHHVLVALDGTAPAARVLPWLRRLCGGAGTTIHLVTVTPPGRATHVLGRAVAYAHQMEEQDHGAALARLRSTAAELRDEGYDVVVEARTGADPATAVLAAAHDAGRVDDPRLVNLGHAEGHADRAVVVVDDWPRATELGEELLDAVATVSQALEGAGEVAPMSHPTPIRNVFREDVVRPSLAPEAVLAGAPASEGQRFLVPKILGEE